MEKEKNGEIVTKVADGAVLALQAEVATDFVDGNQKKQNKRIRNDMVGNKMKGKEMKKVFQIRNDMTSTSRDIEKCQCMKEAAEQGKKTIKKHKTSIENDPPTEPPSCNFIQERNACAVTKYDIESGSQSSSSSDEVLVSWVRQRKSRKHQKRDNSVESNKATEKSNGTKFSVCSVSQKDSLLQLPVNSCLNEDSDSEVNSNAPDVCISTDANDADLNAKRSIENDSKTEPPSKSFTPERNASAVTTQDIKSGTCSGSSFDEVLSSSIGRQNSKQQEKRDDSVERNNETEKSGGTTSLTCSLLEKDLLLQRRVNSCSKEDSEANCNALGVCLSRNKSESEMQHEKHDLAESIEICQDLGATCSTPCSNAGNICSAAESNGKPVSEISNTCTSLVETHDDPALVANSTESDILFTCERGNFRSELLQLPVNSYSKEDSEVNCSALGVCLSRDKSEAEKQREKQDLAESIEICQDLGATCSTPCSNMGNICSASESNGKPVSEMNKTCTSFVETHDDPALVANSMESDILFTCEKGKFKNELLQLPVNSCSKEDSEVYCNAPGVCLSKNKSEAEKQHERHDLAESIEICQDLGATCSTPYSNMGNICSASESNRKPASEMNNTCTSFVETHNDPALVANSTESDILFTCERGKVRSELLQLPVNSCSKEDSEVNCNAPGVCLSRNMSEAEKQHEKHDLAESIEICQDLGATCSTPCSNAGNICSAAESNGKPVCEIIITCTSLVETHDDPALVANSTESDIIFTCERGESISSYSRQKEIVSDPPAVNSQSIPDTRSLLLVPNREEKPSLVQSVEAPPCSKHMHLKEFDDADVRLPSLLEQCASRDKIAHNNDMALLSREGSLAGNSRKKLLVLDINGLLADVVYDVLEGYTPDAIISGRSVFKRPFCDDFLEFCFARFNVGVWSSRMRRNVELILDFLMGNAKHKLLFCWDQSHCTDSYRTTVENRKKPLLVKKLKKLWRKYEPGLPWELGEYNESNTLLLDDSPYKAVCNPPYTAVFPTTYRYTDKEDNSLGPGGELRVYLEGLAMAENVQKYVQENPIGNRPITEKNPSWRFYLEVIRACSSPEHSPIRPTFHWQGYR